LKKDYQILIIFGTNIRDTTGHQTTIQVPPHPTSASALPGKNRRNKICVHCWSEQLSACLCSCKGPTFRTFTAGSWTTGQLDKLPVKL